MENNLILQQYQLTALKNKVMRIFYDSKRYILSLLGQ